MTRGGTAEAVFGAEPGPPPEAGQGRSPPGRPSRTVQDRFPEGRNATTDFVIVVAASLAAALSAPAAGPAAKAPLHAPTVGFNVYKDATSCEQAAERLTPPPGKRLVCLPVVPYAQEIATAY
jgi:hypothetical protein